MRDLRERLQDILEAVALIELEQAKGRAAFDASPLIQTWMVHHLMMSVLLVSKEAAVIK